MRVKTHQAEDITHSFLLLADFLKHKNVQWRGLGFNWDDECLLWKRSRWVECRKGTLITVAEYPVIEWMVTPRRGVKLLSPAELSDDTICCCTWKREACDSKTSSFATLQSTLLFMWMKTTGVSCSPVGMTGSSDRGVCCAFWSYVESGWSSIWDIYLQTLYWPVLFFFCPSWIRNWEPDRSFWVNAPW